MRAISATLEKRLKLGAAPPWVLVEAEVRTAAAIVDTYDEWGTADSLTGLTRRLDGTLELAGTATTLLDQTTSDGFITDLDRASPTIVAAVEWKTTAGFWFNNVRARLHPDRTGAGREVDFWRCQVFRVHRVRAGPSQILQGAGSTGDYVELLPISPVVDVTETGTAEREVTFTFPTPIGRPTARPLDGGTVWNHPVVVIQIWAVTKTGATAGNVGWRKDSAQTSYTAGGGDFLLEDWTITEPAESVSGDRFRFWQITAGGGGVARLRLQYDVYANDDATFTTNPLDLGAAPPSAAAMRFLGRAITPTGTAVRFYARNDADSAWVEYTDGQTAADLGLTASQTRKMRVELDTNAAGDSTPRVLAMGIETITVTPLHHVAEVVSVDWVVDPVRCEGRVSELRLRGIKDGVNDFNAAIEKLMSDNHPSALSFALYYGHPDDDRSTWAVLDVFPIVEDMEHDGHSIVVIALSSLGYLTGGPGRLPRYNTATNEREDLVYTNPTDTSKEIWADLVEQLEVPARYIGPGPEDVTFSYVNAAGAVATLDTSTISLSKRIADSEGRVEVDAVSFLNGFATTSHSGRIRAVRMRGGQGALHDILPADQIRWTAVTPGFRLRRPVIFAEYGAFENPDELDETRAFHQAAIDNLGQGRIQTFDRLPESAMSYVQTQALAEAITGRELAAFGAGLLQWSFESIYPRPGLTLGDMIGVETDRFVARDPIAARALRGALWAIGRVVGIHDAAHTQFSIHMESWADIIAAAEVVTRIGLVELASCRAYLTGDDVVSTGTFWTYPIAFAAEDHDTSDIHDNAVNNTRLTVPPGLGGRYSVVAHLPYSGLSGATFGVTILKNGATNIAWLSVNPAVAPTMGSWDLSLQTAELAAGEYLEVVFSGAGNSGWTLAGGSADETYFAIRRNAPIRPVISTPQTTDLVNPMRRWRLPS